MLRSSHAQIDSDGGAVVGAPVVLIHVGSGERRTGITGNDGTLQFTGLTPSEYRLEIAAQGFDLHARTITLDAGQRTVEASLQLAAVREEITVLGAAAAPTIGRVEAPLRDQPLTVNTLSREYLEAHAINDVVTALQHVPNVNAYTNYGVYQYFTFRGFRENVQMVDGIRNEGNRVTTQLANVERVEVLKGPASVLYGTGALGGTVNIVLKKPTPDPDLRRLAGPWALGHLPGDVRRGRTPERHALLPFRHRRRGGHQLSAGPVQAIQRDAVA